MLVLPFFKFFVQRRAHAGGLQRRKAKKGPSRSPQKKGKEVEKEKLKALAPPLKSLVVELEAPQAFYTFACYGIIVAQDLIFYPN